MDRLDRRVDGADHALRLPVDAHLALQLGGEPALDHARAEAAMRGRRHRRPACLLPAQAEAAVVGRPSNRHPAALGREGAVFERIRTELVQGHRQGDRALGPQPEIVAGEAHPFAGGAQRGADDRGEAGAVPSLVGQQVVHRAEVQQPLLEGRTCIGADVLQGQGRDRLHDRQRVLHPVIELVQQQLEMVLVAVPLGHVGSGRHAALQIAAFAAQRCGAHQQHLPVAVVEAHFEQLFRDGLAARGTVQGPLFGWQFDTLAKNRETHRPVQRAGEVELARDAQKIDGTAISNHVTQLAVGREPDRGRDGLQHRLEFGRALAQCVLGLFTLLLRVAPVRHIAHEHAEPIAEREHDVGDVAAGQRQGLALQRRALCHGLVQEAAALGAAVLREVVPQAGADHRLGRLAEMTFRSLVVEGDAPILVDRIERQADAFQDGGQQRLCVRIGRHATYLNGVFR